jgi:hypothetical protein
MKAHRRILVGMCALAAFLLAGVARAQVLSQVPQDALVVIKLNNPEGVSKKLAAFAQKLGLAQMIPGMADPLAMLRQEAGLKDGLDAKGEAAVALFKPAPGEQEPQAVALIPVTDYKAFLSNFGDVKQENGADTFTLPENPEPFYASNWGKYAAISPWAELVKKKGSGIKVEGAIGKQLAERDVVMIANMEQIRPMIMPGFQQFKQMLPQFPMVDPQGNEMVFQKQVAIEMMDGVEQFLNELQVAAVSLNLADPGFTATFTYQFTPDSQLAKSVQGLRKSDASMLNGLPQGSYLFYGGFTYDGKQFWNWMKDWYVGALKQAKLDPAEAKSLDQAIAAYERMLSASNAMTFGVMPPAPGAFGKTGIVNGVFIMQGDAKAMLQASKEFQQHQSAIMKASGAGGITVKSSVTPNAKTIAGVALDQYKMEFVAGPNADPNAVKMIEMMYGKSLTGYLGAINDKMVVSSMGVDDAKVTAAINAAKANQAPMATTPHAKTALSQLPQNRVGLFYVDVANLVNTGMQIAQQFGAGANMKMPPNLPPVAVSVASEGNAIRFDTYVPTDLVESLVSFGMQMQMQQQNQQRARPQRQGGV